LKNGPIGLQGAVFDSRNLEKIIQKQYVGAGNDDGKLFREGIFVRIFVLK